MSEIACCVEALAVPARERNRLTLTHFHAHIWQNKHKHDKINSTRWKKKGSTFISSQNKANKTVTIAWTRVWKMIIRGRFLGTRCAVKQLGLPIVLFPNDSGKMWTGVIKFDVYSWSKEIVQRLGGWLPISSSVSVVFSICCVWMDDCAPGAILLLL